MVISFESDFMSFLMFAFIFGAIIVGAIEEYMRNKKRNSGELYRIKNKKEIEFEKFDDLDEVEKNRIEEQKLENELDSLRRTAYSNMLREQAENKNYTADVEKLERYIQGERILGSVKVKKEEVHEAESIQKLKAIQVDFNPDLFKEWSKAVFLMTQVGKEEELTVATEIFADPIYNNLIRQIREFKRDGIEYIKDDVMVDEVKIIDYSKTTDREIIKVYINAKMKEYIVKLDTREVLRGDTRLDNSKHYVMTFQKKSFGLQEGFMRNCPNCGGAIEQVEFGRCMYCKALIIPIRYNWTLTNIEAV